ncbi:hypothetical protein [Streptomyces sp. NPDC004658]|uniref:hypothetical protein n=1 Tax=Streptomyces sp. NPDC004658 TaxID=3154672 RepID=UPI0033A947C9
MVTGEVRALALAHYARQQAAAVHAVARVRELWQRIDHRRITGSWQQLAPLLVAAVTDAQRQAAALADPYVAAVVEAEDADPTSAGRVRPGAFAGIASDGRPLLSLLYQPVIDWKVRMLAGQSVDEAFRGSLASALRITATQVADAGRGATGAAMAGRRTIQGYVRVVQPPACARCIILAGKEYGWNRGFQRHPRCDCIHLPTTLVARNQHRRGFIDPDDYFRGLSRAEQDRVFGEAGARAIREGADMAQVVNARRGMTTMTAYGRQVQATTEGATRRGAFYRLERRRAIDRGLVPGDGRGFQLRTPRLMPEEIYRLAESRDEAISLLRRFGYLT